MSGATGDAAPSTLSRRELLGGIGLLATAGEAFASAVARAAAEAAGPAGAADAAAMARLERFVRLRSAPGHAPVMWVADGLLLAKPAGGAARPLLRNTTLSFTQVAPRGVGSYDFRLEEVGYFRALDDDAILESWTNPVTGLRIAPRHYRTPEALQLAATGPSIAPPPPGLEVRGSLRVLAELGDTLTLAEDLYVRIPATPARVAAGGEPARAARAERFLASLGTYTGRAAALDAPTDAWVDCSFHYSTLNSFADWLGFGALDGAQSLRLAGIKRPHADIAAIPAWLRARVQREHPGFLELPQRWLGDGWLGGSKPVTAGMPAR